MRVQLQNDSREFFIDVSYGAPWEPISGPEWRAHLWRNRPCCFLHFGLFRTAGELTGASGRQIRLGGKRGRLLAANGQGPFFGNHLRFSFVERGVHWVASLHAFGPAATERLLGILVQRLRIVQRREHEASSPQSSRLVGGAPVAVAVTAGEVWVATQGNALAGVPGEVIRFRRGTRQIVSRLPLGSVRALAARSDWVWASTVLRGRTTIVRIDSRTGRVAQRTVLPDREFADSLTVLNDRVWVSSLSGVVSEINAATGRLERRIDVGGPLGGIVARANSLWVARFAHGSVVRIDADTGRILATVRVGRAPRAVLASSGTVWVGNVGSGTLSAIDVATNRVTKTISVGGSPYGIASSSDSIHVTDTIRGRIISIDKETRKLLGSPVAVGGDPLAIAADTDETLWVVRNTAGDLLRLTAP